MSKNITEDLVIGVAKSDNRKIGKVATTYASQASCPSNCVFRNNGCYAEGGYVGFTTRRLNKSNPNASPLEVAQVEASVIDRMSGKLPLRLHVVGDCSTPEAARTVSEAAGRYIIRGDGQIVWTYTHAAEVVDREDWGNVSVLASCETTDGIKRAHARGYATAIVVEEHPEDGKLYELDGEKILPCPEQTRGRTCDTCKLCWDDKKLLERGITIAFAAHGQREEKVKERLHVG